MQINHVGGSKKNKPNSKPIKGDFEAAIEPGFGPDTNLAVSPLFSLARSCGSAANQSKE